MKVELKNYEYLLIQCLLQERQVKLKDKVAELKSFKSPNERIIDTLVNELDQCKRLHEKLYCENYDR